MLTGSAFRPQRNVASRLMPLLVLFLLPACAKQLGTQSQAKVTPAQYYFDCDAPPGRLTTWRNTLDVRSLTISGTIEVKEPYSHPKWKTTAAILLAEQSNRVGFELVPQDGKDLFVLRSYPRVSFSDQEGTVISPTESIGRNHGFVVSAPFRTGESVHYSLRWRESEHVQLKVGDGPWTEIELQFHPRDLSLSCSTGWILFERIILD